jgi:adenine-specific DNA-methyltransferase
MTSHVLDRSWNERELVALALQLGAADVSGWSAAEQHLANGLPTPNRSLVSQVRKLIREGQDPLGDLFTQLRSPAQRREQGATYTPPAIVRAMSTWAREQAVPDRIIDPGVGSGRFLIQGARHFPRAQLVGVDVDPLATAIARANLAALGLAKRAQVILGDYRSVPLRAPSRTLFLGNPPYVRHHQIPAKWKSWLSERALALGLHASQLAGMHVHFFLATVMAGRAGDCGALITAAEWLDVNYGKLVRELFLGSLGGKGIVVVEPTAMPFPDAASTAAITFFELGSRAASIRMRRVVRLAELKDLSGGRTIRRDRLEAERRWSRLMYRARECPAGFVELGDICRVHRGQVTGANKIWIAGEHTRELPARVLYRSVTRARELIGAGKLLVDSVPLKSVVDLPQELDEFAGSERRAVDRFLKLARRQGADAGYIARHRRAWWSVGLRQPAPILATYMARRSPAFVRNLASARHLNIAHGLYPREALSEDQLRGLVDYLSSHTSVIDGRTYAGGLTKFEPKEMERLFVPRPEDLASVRERP